MKAFKNIQSKLYVQTKEWVANEQEMNNNRKPKVNYKKQNQSQIINKNHN
jgi:hypothetical protein